jgi:hypothetical protein
VESDGFVVPWMLEHFRAAAAFGDSVQVHYVVLRPSVEVTLRRAQGRRSKNALTDEEPVLHMWSDCSARYLREVHSRREQFDSGGNNLAGGCSRTPVTGCALFRRPPFRLSRRVRRV